MDVNEVAAELANMKLCAQKGGKPRSISLRVLKTKSIELKQ
jgi:hypothetical protein